MVHFCTKKRSSGFIQRMLDYILVSNTLQELLTITEILTPISNRSFSGTLLTFKRKKKQLEVKDFRNLVVL